MLFPARFNVSKLIQYSIPDILAIFLSSPISVVIVNKSVSSISPSGILRVSRISISKLASAKITVVGSESEFVVDLLHEK